MATWRMDALKKQQTLPNYKMDVLPKTSLQTILAAKWFLRYSSTYPNQQRPLPSHLYVFILLLWLEGTTVD